MRFLAIDGPGIAKDEDFCLSVPKLHSLTTISVLALSVDRIGIDQHTAEPYAGSYANRH
jgi:hypothetical protein